MTHAHMHLCAAKMRLLQTVAAGVLGFPGYVHQYYVLWYTSGSVWVRLAQSTARVVAQNSIGMVLLTVMDWRLRRAYLRLPAASSAALVGGAGLQNARQQALQERGRWQQ